MTDLLARLEVAEAGYWRHSNDVLEALGFKNISDPRDCFNTWSRTGRLDDAFTSDAVTTSLDAALALAKRVYPEGWLDLYIHGGKASAAQCFEGNRAYTATHASSPIAVCIAILKATHKAEGAEG